MPAPVQTIRDCARQAAKSPLHSSQVFSALGCRLSEAATISRVAEIILQAADELLGWDSCSLDLYSPELDTTTCVLAMDILNGRRTEVTPRNQDTTPSPGFRRVLCDGPQLILREGAPQLGPELVSFGDKARPSASLMFVPIRYRRRVTGVVTIQSYAPKAYAEEDLNTLLALADHCGGTVGRIQTQEALRQEQTLMLALMENLPARVYFKDAASRFLRVNPAMARLFGLSNPAQALGKSDADFFSAEHARQALADEQEIIRTGQPLLDLEEKATWPDGTETWVLTTKLPLQDGAGRIIGTCGITSDITERKHAQLSALALSELGQSLVSATTQDEAVRVLSQVADELFGWDACGFYLYSPETDLIHPVLYMDIINGRRIEVPPPAQDGQPSPANRRIIEKGAELMLKEESSPAMDATATPFGDTSRPSAAIMRVPLRLRTNKVTGVISLHSYTPQAYSQKDLKTLQTLADCCGVALERIWADEALRRSESQFRLVWDSSADGMRLTNREGTMLRVNDAYCRMVQKSKTELEGQVLTIVHSAANADFVLGTYQKRIDSKTLEPHLETEVTLWNGRDVWFELSNSLLEVPGQPPLVLSIFRDITQRKQAAEELERLHRRLLEVSRQAGMAEVATSVLHNVGNVLNSVNVSSSLLSDKVHNSKVTNLIKAVRLLQTHADDLAGFLTRDAKGRQLPGYLCSVADHLVAEHQEILEELKSLSGNIDHIKEIVAMQQSYARVLGVVESLPVAELVEDALRLNSGAMERHRVKVIREYSEVPPILVDKHKVLQILVNLIRNAKYALDDRGHSDKQMVLRIGLNGNQMVKISVVDNGVGIPTEHLTRIFEHGFTTRKEGHGFGLHNGALAAKELGGSLIARSDGPGKGAMFTLELPCQPRTKGHDTRLLAKRV
jgi:PAS domain S-box-containing protein